MTTIKTNKQQLRGGNLNDKNGSKRTKKALMYTEFFLQSPFFSRLDDFSNSQIFIFADSWSSV